MAETSRNPTLEGLLAEISTTEAGSPVWRDAVIRLDEQLLTHSRGEYGAKVAPVSVARSYMKEYDRFRKASGPVIFAAAVHSE